MNSSSSTHSPSLMGTTISSKSPTTSNSIIAPSVFPPSSKMDGDDVSVGASESVFLIMLMIIAISISFWLKNSSEMKKYVTDSAATMILGTIAGLFIHLKGNQLNVVGNFPTDVFFFILLPPIIFDAGFNVKKSLFFENITPILSFAVIGTLISSFSIGILTYWFFSMNLSSSMASATTSHKFLLAFQFGALISSVDPVTILSLLNDRAVDSSLHAIVFGESILNDAVAIVLFRVFLSEEESGVSIKSLPSLIVKFLFVLISSIVVGLLCGLTTSLLLKKFRNISKYPTLEIQSLFLTAFFSFSFAELINLSGVTSLFTTGLALSHYCYYNLSAESQLSSCAILESLSKSSETLIFIIVGISLFAGERSNKQWDFGLLFFSLFNCFFTRALHVFPISFILNLITRWNHARRGGIGVSSPSASSSSGVSSSSSGGDDASRLFLPFNVQVAIFFSGIRGAVSLALAMQLDKNLPGVKEVQTSTLGLVLLTTLIIGANAFSVFDRLNLTMEGDGYDSSNNRMDEVNRMREDFTAVPDGLHEEEALEQNQSFWARMDRRVMIPMFRNT